MRGHDGLVPATGRELAAAPPRLPPLCQTVPIHANPDEGMRVVRALLTKTQRIDHALGIYAAHLQTRLSTAHQSQLVYSVLMLAPTVVRDHLVADQRVAAEIVELFVMHRQRPRARFRCESKLDWQLHTNLVARCNVRLCQKFTDYWFTKIWGREAAAMAEAEQRHLDRVFGAMNLLIRLVL